MGQKNIKIKIGDRVYPLTVSDKEEDAVYASVKKIDANIAKLKSRYKISDTQDLLAMTSLELATKQQNEPTKPKSNSKELDDLLELLNTVST